MWKFVASLLLLAALGLLQVEAFRFFNWRGAAMERVDCTVVRCGAYPVCPNDAVPIIPPGQCCPVCPPGSCPIKGQVYKQCGTACPPTCAEPNPFCTRQCVAGCQCPQGTVLDETAKKCVTLKQCSSCPIKGQEYQECGSACPPTCAEPNPFCTRQCVAGCQCPQGTVLDEIAKKCVTLKQCSSCPIKGQEYQECGTACPPTCGDPFPFCTKQCVAGCQCPQGTVLDETAKKCVTRKECRSCPIKGQEYQECGSACPPTCDDPFPRCTKQCVAGCQCPQGTVLDEIAKKCVTLKQCKSCPIKGQEYQECGSACPPTCDDPLTFCTRQCVAGCQCPQGTVLDEIAKKCVTLKQCKSCPIKGQEYQECGSACPPTCDDPFPSCTRQCVAGCQCPPGTVLDETAKKCVTLKQCKSCPIKGQEYQECGSACPPTCDDPFPSCTRQCVAGCQCPQGTVLDETAKKCVTLKQCSSCPIKGQEYQECGSACPPTCDDPFPSCTRQCVAGCQCPQGTVLDETAKKCVTLKQCGSCPIKGQEYQECGSACPPTCDDPFPFCTRQCVAGCQCPQGTVLDETAKKCVTRKQCRVPRIDCRLVRCAFPDCPFPITPPGQCCAVCPKQLPIDCSAVSCLLPSCPDPITPPGQCCAVCPKPVDCSAVLCPRPSCPDPITPPGQCCAVCPKAAMERVDCTVVRCGAYPVCPNDAVPIIPPGQCCPVCPPGSCPIKGQVYKQCGTACPPTCAEPNPFCTKQCVAGCQCPPGTVLDEIARKCVTLKQCSSCPIKGQEYQQCGSACPPTCDDPFPRCALYTKRCVAGCQCPPGTVLDEIAKKCVTLKECESCPIKGQVYQECGTACPPTCDDPLPFCTKQCVAGCQCPPGTVLDEIAKKCVTLKECESCPIKGQVYQECGTACPPTCAEPSVPFCTKQCVAGCQCPPGTVLDEIAKKCVTLKECESCPIKGQVYQECGTACPPTCDDPFPFCTKQCVAGCQCPQGTVLDETAKKCVTRKECRVPRIDCRLVRCAFPDCPFPITPPGQCCAVCPKQLPIDCSAVSCLLPSCPDPITPPGQCCAVCPKPVDCSAVLCPRPSCPDPITPPGQCCAVCPKAAVERIRDCKFVLCAFPDCLDAITPPGQCCPVCPGGPGPVLCPIEGQVYQQCGTACPPTCAEPSFPFCTEQCVAGCQCPPGTVLDEKARKCVTLKQCTCPPDCTHNFCSRNPRALCNVPGPREIPGCFRQCQLTFCPACYYSKEYRELPGNCPDCGSPVTSIGCLQNWASCIHTADIMENGQPDPALISQEYFKCYRYPCKLKG